MFKRLRTRLTFIMFATALTPMIAMGFLFLYTDFYGIPPKLRDGLMAVPFLSSFVYEETILRYTLPVILALASGIAIGVCSALAARSITRPIGKTRQIIDEITSKKKPVTTFTDQQVFGRNELGILLRSLINTVQTITLKQDETEQKLFSLQEADRIKTEFISNITCELRTHLTLILGPATSLLETAPQTMSEEDISYLKMIRNNALTLKKTIYNLVAFSRTGQPMRDAQTEIGGEKGKFEGPASHPIAPLKERVKEIDNEFYNPSIPVEADVTALHKRKDNDGVPHEHTILIIEDNEDMRKYLHSVLKDNFEPIFAANEDEAMERIKERPVKLVIIDIDLEGREGYETCRKVKDVVSPLLMPVVILTPRGGTTMRIMGLEAGADCYITKPFEKRELLARLKTLSAQKELFDAIHENNTQLHRAERLRSEFVATISHELRTPLSSILLASELLLDEISGEINEEQKKQLGIIQLSSQNLLRLIHNVLSLSKINAGKMDINPATVDLKKLIDNVLKEISPLANEKGLHLQSNLYKIPVILSDGDKIRQVLLNILSNAIKFTPFGGRIDISARIPNGIKMVEISIADTGVGMPLDTVDDIFEKYKQIKVAGNQNMEGTGLGLSITKQLVILLGGEIWVRSRLGEGSVFSFTLPQRGEMAA